MEFEIRISGAVELRAAGRRGDLRSTKTRVALAALAWDAGRTVSVDTLIHRIWDDHPPGKAREALHAHVSRVRAALRTLGEDAPTLRGGTNLYSLETDPDRVDLRRYTTGVERARALRDGGDAKGALRLLDRAEDHWHGEPLAGITGSWAEHLRTAAGETRLVAALTRAEILLDGGKYTDAVPVLLPLVEARPVDEALAERLAVALYGSNRTAEATRLLQRARQRVVKDIGLDAGRGLHRIHQGILAGTPAAVLFPRAAPEERPAPRPARRVPDNLPRDVPWAGRREELRRLTASLCEERGAADDVVTVEAIHGMGGVGKSALAIHLAHRLRDRFPDGRLFLHLGGDSTGRTPRTPVRALTELLRLLGTAATQLPGDLDELVALWRAAARDRRMLVVLDDATSSAQVRPLLPGASPTAVVVTSRRRLPGLPGVRPVSLDVLPPEDAAALFTRRLGPRPGTDASDVAGIVRRCGHLPLAVEIAASRLLAHTSWTTSDLLRRLAGADGRLAQLRDAERSLAHVFAVSYDALDADQRLVFRRSGLHPGVEFSPHAVAALTGLPAATVERVLEELLAQSLVSEPLPHRFTMHDLLRDYARTLVATGGADSAAEVRRAERRLVDHYLHAADRADRLAYPFRSRMDPVGLGMSSAGSRKDSAGPRMNSAGLRRDSAASRRDPNGSRRDSNGGSVPPPPHPELTDARSAEQWLITESANLLDLAARLASQGTARQLALGVHVLAGFLDMEGHLAAAEPLLRRAVAHWHAAGDRAAEARALLDLCAVYTHGSRYEEAIATAETARAAARSVGDRLLEAECVHRIVISLWQTGQYAPARSLQQESLDFLSQTGDALRIARCRNVLGIAHLHLAEHDEALACFTSALAEFREIGDERGRYSALNNIAEAHKKSGRMESAESAYREALTVAEGLGNPRDRATLRINLASVLDALGRTGEALTLYGGALPVLREVGDRRTEGIALTRIGAAYRAGGRVGDAIHHLHTALGVLRDIRAAGEEAEALYQLGLAERDAGHPAEAAAHLEAAAAASRRLGATAEEERAVRVRGELRGETAG
ncbi:MULTISPECIES: AfsR/SARP family transcriptional regulator [unclassified Streptomyces]|uniref:AfsR/SARP family transcriptional regulator n=1 Tax=unclassified Streptomyces TaxID=2593676 RepID=UPI0005610847|nr:MULTISPECIES: AfsR/SARP family transcriptional regulator [unclassified Streptomyces]